MRLVELMGPPGVGKSTLRLALAERIDVMTGPALRALPPLAVAARGGFLASLAISEIWREAARTSIRRAAAVEREPGDRWAIDDHGPMQRGLDIAWFTGNDETCRRYFAAVPLPAAIVLCVAPPSVIRSRNAERAQGGVKPDRGAEAEGWIHAVEVASAALRDRGTALPGGITVMVLNLQCALADGTQALLDHLAAVAAAC